MHRFLLGTLAAATLAACVSDTVYHAPGVSVASRDATFAQCEAQSLRQYPVRNETRFRPPTFIPATETCDAAGICTRTEGYWEPGDAYTVDINADFRRTATQGCMGANGFSRIELPFCEEGTAVSQSTTIPTLNGGTCLLRQRGSEPLIVNPAG